MTYRRLGALLLVVAAPVVSAQVPDDVKQAVIDRCRAQMQSIGGATMVKFCVDQDFMAYEALGDARYLRYESVVERCTRQMLSMGGWEMVKFCADEDIAAEQALEKY